MQVQVHMQLQQEQLTPELAHELSSMFADYYDATEAKDGIPPYDFDWEVYEMMGDAVMFCTARDTDNALLGCTIYFIQPHLHHRGLIVASCDGLCVAHNKRGQGTAKALYAFTEPLLVQRGAKRIVNSYRTVYNRKPIFEELGFAVEEHVYVKRIA